ncbi:hypothetical protein AB0H36_27525 [Kribbella sp. NPDC050820]|uniref:hypothetical protein n=1 Tax=Kribbella sp. NPDC050820 TaxID=3155408 RepID=UPI00340B5F28
MLELVTIKQADLVTGDVLHRSGDLVIGPPDLMPDNRVWLDVLSLEPPVLTTRAAGGPRELTGVASITVEVDRPEADDLPYSAPARHVERGGIPAAHTDGEEIAAQMRLWYRDGAHFSTPESLLYDVPTDVAAGAFRAACRWINAQAWADDDPDRIAAERMTVHEVIACIFLHYAPGNRQPWDKLIQATASWS